MNIDGKDMAKFIKEVSNYYNIKCLKEQDTAKLKDIPCNHNECIFLLDFAQNKIIYSRGFQNVLGYSDNDITLDFIMNNHHPDDSEIVKRINKASLIYCMENPVDVFNNILVISYRRRKKDGSYIKVLHESSTYEVNDKGITTQVLIKLFDISFMDTSNRVKWKFTAKNLDKEAFKKIIYKVNYEFFTPREIEIIKETAKGLTNNLIAEKLYISKHTVATHKKNILKKSNCHNTIELLNFCKNHEFI